MREMARALTGWRADWRDGVGMTNFRFDREFHDGRRKRIYGRRGRFDWRDAADLAVGPPAAPELLRHQALELLHPHAAAATARAARCSGSTRARTTTSARCSPRSSATRRSTTGPRMVKPPVVYIAGLLRALRPRDRHRRWAWLMDMSGQTLFAPPNVAGWDDTRWIDTATWRGRWMAANYALEGRTLDPDPEKTRYPSLKQAERRPRRSTPRCASGAAPA